jgi:hypothetical protein
VAGLERVNQGGNLCSEARAPSSSEVVVVKVNLQDQEVVGKGSDSATRERLVDGSA